MSIAIRNYALVTIAYWGFTLTDGAIRMLVLLHFYTLGYSPFEIALLFLLYEFFGMATNLVGGWLGSRFGLKSTLFAGLALQVLALFVLSLFNPAWPVIMAVVYVMGVQALSGIAKDLTKMSAKSAVKTLAPEGAEGTLFKWVAILTGSKNTLKGVGFFLGGLLLAAFGFAVALQVMAAGLVAVLAVSALMLRGDIGQAKTKVKFRTIFSKSTAINRLSAARFFLFGARDLWFAVGLPLYLASALGWGHSQVGAYMAAWVIGYGIIQASVPAFIRRGGSPNSSASRLWLLLLTGVTVAITGALMAGVTPVVTVLGGLVVFGFVFAVNSAIHSYLVLALSKVEHVSMDVGFYYMANAGGRLAGMLLSGLAYQWGGLVLCLVISAAFLAAAFLFSLALPDNAKFNPA